MISKEFSSVLKLVNKTEPRWASFSNMKKKLRRSVQMLLLEMLIPDAVREYEICDAYWRNATNYETYMATVMCVRLALGALKMWPDKIRFYRKSEAFARDGWISAEQ